jgi:hypothetical protein
VRDEIAYRDFETGKRDRCPLNQLVRPLRQLDVASGQRAGRVRPPAQRDPIPTDNDSGWWFAASATSATRFTKSIACAKSLNRNSR